MSEIMEIMQELCEEMEISWDSTEFDNMLNTVSSWNSEEIDRFWELVEEVGTEQAFDEVAGF